MRYLSVCLLVMFGLAACNPATEPKEQTPPMADVDLPEVSKSMDPATRALIKGQAWLDENKVMPGIKVTKSGLQYKVLREGDKSGAHPKPGQYICAHYSGKFIDGDVFDSSYDRKIPMAYVADGFIPGWNEALSMMRPGDKWQLFIPSDLAYGARGTPGGPIGPNEALFFEMELLGLLDIDKAEYMTTYRVDPTLDCATRL